MQPDVLSQHIMEREGSLGWPQLQYIFSFSGVSWRGGQVEEVAELSTNEVSGKKSSSVIVSSAVASASSILSAPFSLPFSCVSSSSSDEISKAS